VPLTQAPALLQVWIVLPLHWVAPGLHATQPPPRHTGVAPLHVAQPGPQWFASLLVLKPHGDDPPQELYGALHWTPQLPPLQVAAPFGGGGHWVQLAPQWSGSLSDV
jgi:hypothetical protein